MQTRALGRTGRSVGLVGFAGAPLITPSREREPKDVQRVLATALDMGIDLIEVPEKGESLAGEVVREQRARDRAIVMIEAPARAIVRRVESALRATRLEIIPLVMIRGRLDPAARHDIHSQVRAGKVMHWGVAVGDDDAIADDVEVVFAPRERALAGAIISLEMDKLEDALGETFACALVDLPDPVALARALTIVG